MPTKQQLIELVTKLQQENEALRKSCLEDRVREIVKEELSRLTLFVDHDWHSYGYGYGGDSIDIKVALSLDGETISESKTNFMVD